MFYLDKRKVLIIKNLIYNKDYISSEVLASVIGSNSRTIREDMKIVEALLENFGVEVISKASLGTKLKIIDYEEYQEFLQVFTEKYSDNSFILGYNKERIDTIIYMLLVNDYIKTSYFMDLLFVSKAILYLDIKIVRKLLSNYHLELCHRPHYGMSISGLERHLRVAISDYINYDEENITSNLIFPIYNLDNKRVYNSLVKCLNKYNIHVSLKNFKEIQNYIIVSEYRFHNGFKVRLNDDEFMDIFNTKEFFIVKEMLFEFWSDVPEHEIANICIYIISRRIYDKEILKDKVNLYFLADEVKHYLNTHAKLNFLDEDLSMLPYNIKGMLFRIKNGYEYRNIQVINTKQKNTIFEYAVLISDYFSKKKYMICENEIIVLANEMQQQLIAVVNRFKYSKQNICIVSAMGRNYCFIYEKFLRDNYSRYINNIIFKEFYEIYEIEDSYDILLTDIPKCNFRVSKPIFQIKHNLNNREKKHLHSLLSLKEQRFEKFFDYFSKDLFFLDMNFKTKKQAIQHMTDKMIRSYPISNKLYDNCILRDERSSSERGNNVAICHSFYSVCRKTHISVAILKKPIMWDSEPVQIIFLIALGVEEQYLYDSVSNLQLLISDIKLIHNIINAQCYEEFRDALKNSFDNNELL